MSTNMYSGRSNLELSEKCDKIAWMWDLILIATPQPAMWTFLKRLLQKPKPDLTGANNKQTETHQCDNAWHCEFTWATFTKFENGETVWERHCGTGSDVLTIINMDRESGVRAQHGKSRRISTGKEQPATTTVQTKEVTHTHTRTHHILTTRLS